MSASEADNRTLLADAAAGGQASWNEIVRRYNRLVWSIARGFRLSQPEDAVQNTWLRLVENLDRITEPDQLASWLATTTRRECLQLLRRSARQPSVGWDEVATEPVDPAPPVDTGLLLEERDSQLWRAVDRLSDKCRQLLRTLMATPPPSYDAVSAALDMPIGSIGPARQRCLNSLRRLVSGDLAVGTAGDD